MNYTLYLNCSFIFGKLLYKLCVRIAQELRNSFMYTSKRYATVSFVHISVHISKLCNLCSFKFSSSNKHPSFKICKNKIYFQTFHIGIIKLMGWVKHVLYNHFRLKSQIIIRKIIKFTADVNKITCCYTIQVNMFRFDINFEWN